MPLNSLLDNKFEFFYQTKQPIPAINDIPYWEFEAYIERLNIKNKELEKQAKKQQDEQEKAQQNNSSSKFGNIMKRFKAPKLK